MDENVEKFIHALISQVGYHEQRNNWNVYADFIDTNYPNFYNAKKQGKPWCCIMIHSVMIQLFGYEETKLLTNLPEHNSGAGCEGCANAYRSGGQRIRGRENVQVGDQFILGATSYDHTGIIYEIVDSAKGIYKTIEGNYQDSVAIVTRRYNEFIFVGRPKWDALETVQTVQTVETVETVKTEQCQNCKHCYPCKELIAGDWMYFHICNALADEPDGWCLVVGEDDRCEMFTKK